jgi:acyl carrier protein
MQTQGTTAEDVRREIRNLLGVITERNPAEISDTARFDEDLHVDSLMAMEIMVTVDKRFHIDIPEDEFKEIKSIGDAVVTVLRHLPIQDC